MIRSLPFLLLCLAACNDQLHGTWSGTDHTGLPVTLVFEPDGHMEMVGPNGPLSSSLEGNPRLEYEVLNEVEPPRLSMVFLLGDSIRRPMPLGVYKIENGRLVICMATSTQPTLGVIPFGEPTFEWPTEFTGDCFTLDRSN
jgi:hypothetical protein